jgi:Na+-transporting methylmalonyl-CoA/oxaloacetate decarboxylase gamma subunit
MHKPYSKFYLFNQAYGMRILFLSLLVIYIFAASQLWGQRARDDIKAKSQKGETAAQGDKGQKGDSAKGPKQDKQQKGSNPWEVEVTLYASLPLAVSSPLSELFGMGLGGHLATSFSLNPLLPPMPVGIRAGVLAGYSTFDGGVEEFSASSTRIPAIAFGELDYRIKSSSFSTRLIGRVGQGIALTSAGSSYPKGDETVTTQESSSDATLLVGGGFGLTVASMPRLEYQAMFHMFQVFQTLNGTFVDINIGASYRFGEWG